MEHAFRFLVVDLKGHLEHIVEELALARAFVADANEVTFRFVYILVTEFLICKMKVKCALNQVELVVLDKGQRVDMILKVFLHNNGLKTLRACLINVHKWVLSRGTIMIFTIVALVLIPVGGGHLREATKVL